MAVTPASRPEDGATRPDLVHIAVPAAYVPHIAQLIDELDRRHRPLQAPERRSKPPKHPVHDWPSSELRRFSQGKTRTHQTMTLILDQLSRHPECEHPVAELASSVRLPLDKVIGALGGLTRVVKAYHDYNALGLPMRRVVRRDPGQEQQVFLSMGIEQARRWTSVRDGTRDESPLG